MFPKIEALFNRVYKVIFVPYALVWLIYILGATLVGVASNLLGLSYTASLYFVFIMLLVGLFVTLVWVAIRKIINQRARLKSLNPHIQLKNRETTLQFIDDDKVRYTLWGQIKILTEDVTCMRKHLSWSGPIEDITVLESLGCSVKLQKENHFFGTIIICHFNHKIMKGSELEIKVSLEFSNYEDRIKPYLRTVGPYLPEDLMALSIILQEGQQGRFYERIYRSSDQFGPITENYSKLGMNSHTFSVKKPVQGLSYFIGLEELHSS